MIVLWRCIGVRQAAHGAVHVRGQPGKNAPHHGGGRVQLFRQAHHSKEILHVANRFRYDLLSLLRSPAGCGDGGFVEICRTQEIVGLVILQLQGTHPIKSGVTAVDFRVDVLQIPTAVTRFGSEAIHAPDTVYGMTQDGHGPNGRRISEGTIPPSSPLSDPPLVVRVH